MRKQRFAYSLPSQDESPFFPDSDSLSILSSNYSYPETIWPQITSPETDTLIPFYVYMQPFFQAPVEPISYIPEILESPLTPNTVHPFDDIYLKNYVNLDSPTPGTVYPFDEIYLKNYVNLDSSLSPDTVNPFDDIYLKNYFLTSSDINADSFCYSPCGNGIFIGDLPSSTEISSNENVSDIIQFEEPKTFPILTNYGTIAILLRHLIRVDISPSRAIYVTNSPASCVAAVNQIGDKSCVIHPNGRVHHIGQDIHMVTLDRQAKIRKRGIVFSSNKHCLSYLVDDSGTKTSSEKLRSLNHDFSLDVFYSNNMAEKDVEECCKLTNETKYKIYKNGDEVWTIGELRIKQNEVGDVKITKKGGRYAIKTSPTSGEVCIKTFSAEINIGRYPDKYFVVRKGDKQVTASLKCFNVQNGSQKAGFNSAGKVVLF